MACWATLRAMSSPPSCDPTGSSFSTTTATWSSSDSAISWTPPPAAGVLGAFRGLAGRDEPGLRVWTEMRRMALYRPVDVGLNWAVRAAPMSANSRGRSTTRGVGAVGASGTSDSRSVPDGSVRLMALRYRSPGPPTHRQHTRDHTQSSLSGSDRRAGVLSARLFRRSMRPPALLVCCRSRDRSAATHGSPSPSHWPPART